MNAGHARALAAWLRSQGLTTNEQVRLSPLSGGQSNPTFIIDDGTRRLVLRKKPAGQLVPSAHAIDREYRVMNALRGSGVPVPSMYGYCEDAALLGTPFYVMEYLEGRVITDQSMPGLSATERSSVYDDMNRVLAALHDVDVGAAGLADYSKPGNYFSRQIARWSRQVGAATIPVPAAMSRLMAWLPGHIPPEDETTIIHGDYRLDNLVLHPVESRIIGVLDWELSTLGHPLADFAYHAMSWRIDPAVWRGIAGLDHADLGIPTEPDYLALYSQRTGRDPRAHWEFYLAFNLFRMAAILHGIAQRAADGSAASADAAATGRRAEPLAELGWQCALRYAA
jgi:aminoglycoside phosphotransferase (APT) family kinase protein